MRDTSITEARIAYDRNPTKENRDAMFQAQRSATCVCCGEKKGCFGAPPLCADCMSETDLNELPREDEPEQIEGGRNAR